MSSFGSISSGANWQERKHADELLDTWDFFFFFCSLTFQSVVWALRRELGITLTLMCGRFVPLFALIKLVPSHIVFWSCSVSWLRMENEKQGMVELVGG